MGVNCRPHTRSSHLTLKQVHKLKAELDRLETSRSGDPGKDRDLCCLCGLSGFKPHQQTQIDVAQFLEGPCGNTFMGNHCHENWMVFVTRINMNCRKLDFAVNKVTIRRTLCGEQSLQSPQIKRRIMP